MRINNTYNTEQNDVITQNGNDDHHGQNKEGNASNHEANMDVEHSVPDILDVSKSLHPLHSAVIVRCVERPYTQNDQS